MPRNTPSADAVTRSGAKARSLRAAGALRSFIIASGIGAYTLILHFFADTSQREPASFAENPPNLLFIALSLQAVRWAAHRLVARYAERHGLAEALSPRAIYVIDLVIDGATVLLFALAIFRGIFGVPARN